MDKKRFSDITAALIGSNDITKKIGTLQEKLLHRIIKYYFASNPNEHEIKIGPFYADVFKDEQIIEIQTRAFNKLRKKLDFFLPHYPVTIVYPIPHIKWLSWIDKDTGEVSSKRKSPKKGTFYDSLFELYKIKPYLNHPNLKVCLLLINMEEYRYLNGWSLDKKKGSSRYNRVPVELIDEMYLASPIDYQLFIPDTLPLNFTSKEYQKMSPLNLHNSQIALNILTNLQCVTRVSKQKNLIVYQKNKQGL